MTAFHRAAPRAPRAGRRLTAALVAGAALTLVAACGPGTVAATSSTGALAGTSAGGGASSAGPSNSPSAAPVTVPGLSSPAADGTAAASAPISPTRVVPSSTARPTTPTPTPSAATRARSTPRRSTTPPVRSTSAPSTSRSSTSSTPTTPTTPTTSATPTTHSSPPPPRTSTRAPQGGGSLAGRIVAIDPGHNGDNANHPEIINATHDGGNGHTNTCNTTGTETNDGYSEHAFNWHVASYLRDELSAKGITIVMTRNNDAGVGPCTPVRARIENESGADAVVSIHGDGVDGSVHGFYVLTDSKPLHGEQVAARSLTLARAIRDGLVGDGFSPSNSLGSNGLWTRDDLTGLNFSTKPKILVELGNMRNAQEAATMSSAEGQRAYAHALALGVIAFLRG